MGCVQRAVRGGGSGDLLVADVGEVESDSAAEATLKEQSNNMCFSYIFIPSHVQKERFR